MASKLGLQVGDRYRRWECMTTGAPWLSDVLTASGAAFNSHMGKISARLGKAVTFLLTAIGLRLGLWVENPREAEPPEPGHDRPRKRTRAPGSLFVRELISDSRIDSDWIHLSDGAHFENLALYELVRRHCRFILLSDCGADPDRAFDDFGNAVRRVREDFGVEIKIDITPLQADDGEKARQPMVAGDIVYPSARPGGPPDVGVLLYIKPTLIGDEPSDIAQYAQRNEQFPHETTIDQFYDEAQWESYRRLGRHAIESALKPVTKYLPNETNGHRSTDSGSASHLFVRARYYWPPLPEEDPNLDRIERKWAALEDRLDPPGKNRPAKGIRRLRRQLSLQGNTKPKRSVARENDLVEALPVVREAIRLMEQVYLRTEFGRDEQSPSSRLYMGWFNRFGLWATTPIFQAWWPWLAPFHSSEFTEFMLEMKEFGLRSTVPRGETSVLGAFEERLDACGKPALAPEGAAEPVLLERRNVATGGYARSRYEAWLERERYGSPPAAPAEPRADSGATTEIYELDLVMPHTKTRLNASVLRLTAVEGESGKTAQWRPEDLYVPPGLWAIGVGERFVKTLLEKLGSDDFTRIQVHPPECPNLHQQALYTGAGFSRRDDGGFEADLGK